ncbi:nuclear transport factor 2 family protein [Nocardia niigatensis]
MNVLDELRSREPIFHRPEHGVDFAAMVADEFWEIGASGQRYDRDLVLEVLAERQRTPSEDVWETSEFRCQELAPDLFLLTYLLRQPDRVSRRSTVWRRVGPDWQIVFHQGTVVA